MTWRKLLVLVFEAVIAGLAFAFILLLIFRPDSLTKGTTVEIIQSETPAPKGNVAPYSYSDAVEKAAPAVVNIYSTKRVTTRQHPFADDPFFKRFFGDEPDTPREREETSLGSGVIVSPQGYVLTNNHVISGAEEIQVALRDDRHAAAKLVGSDPETDLAVLKIDLEDLPVITFGQSDKIRTGDVVLAIGNPFGVGQTVTSGIVSATGRTQLGISTYENFIQTDAAINPGNSGGALVNVYGQLIGINTAIFSGSGGSQGIGFAIPSALATTVLEQIVQRGQVVRGWLGVATQDLTPELAESFGLRDASGALVSGVLPKSPADQAGVQPGDVIVDVDGKKIHNAQSMLNVIAQYQPGQEIKLHLLRNGKDIRLTSRVAQRPRPQPAQ